MLLSQFIRDGISSLEALYPHQEARSLVLRLCQDRLGVDSWTHITEPGTVVDCIREAGLVSDLGRLCKGEPLQYVLGWTEFCGRRFNVSPSVLIPRPETEQMALASLEFARNLPVGVRVLDLCTGSGVLAWTLFLGISGSRVTATDISDEALRVASGQFVGESPRFLKSDVLSETVDGGPYDIIMSNPPYILDSERSSMRSNVLDYEPSLALFVPDDDPFVFHRAIAARCRRLLSPGGLGIVEINESLGRESAAVFSDEGLADVRIIDDYLCKNRFILFTNDAISMA